MRYSSRQGKLTIGSQRQNHHRNCRATQSQSPCQLWPRKSGIETPRQLIIPCKTARRGPTAAHLQAISWCVARPLQQILPLPIEPPRKAECLRCSIFDNLQLTTVPASTSICGAPGCAAACSGGGAGTETGADDGTGVDVVAVADDVGGAAAEVAGVGVGDAVCCRSAMMTADCFSLNLDRRRVQFRIERGINSWEKGKIKAGRRRIREKKKNARFNQVVRLICTTTSY